MNVAQSGAWLSIAVLALLGCRTPRTEPTSAVQSLVTPNQFARAMEAVRETRAYIPYAEPGTCDARATWLAALLAAESIPTTKRYLFAPTPSEKLRGPNNIPWDFHVAIMIRANDSHEHMLLDPTWGDDWLMPDGRWRSLMTSNPAALQLDIPGSIDGKDIRNDYRSRQNHVVQSYDEMPHFKMATLEQACGTLLQYQTSVSGLDYGFADQKLKAEMLRVAKALEAQGKLDWGVLTRGAVYCGSKRLQ